MTPEETTRAVTAHANRTASLVLAAQAAALEAAAVALGFLAALVWLVQVVLASGPVAPPWLLVLAVPPLLAAAHRLHRSAEQARNR